MVSEFGDIAVTAEEIIEFAGRYDPQTMHVDPAAAARGPFGGLIASGWHTGSLMMRLFVEHYLSKVATLPRRGSTSCAGCARCGPAIGCGSG